MSESAKEAAGEGTRLSTEQQGLAPFQQYVGALNKLCRALKGFEFPSESFPEGTPPDAAEVNYFEAVIEARRYFVVKCLENKPASSESTDVLKDPEQRRTYLELKIAMGKGLVADAHKLVWALGTNTWKILKERNPTAAEELARTALSETRAVVESARDLAEKCAEHMGVDDAALHQGADADSIWWAALSRDHADVVALLLDKRVANVTTPNGDEELPLHVAARTGRVAVVEVLLKTGADLAARDGRGRTSLHWAAEMGWSEVAKLLVTSSAEWGVADRDGQTPLDLAVQAGHEDVQRLIREARATISPKLAPAIPAKVDVPVRKPFSPPLPGLRKEKRAWQMSQPAYYCSAWSALEESLRDVNEDLAFQAMTVSVQLDNADKARRARGGDALAPRSQETQIEVLEDVRCVVDALKAEGDDISDEDTKTLWSAIKEDFDDAVAMAAGQCAEWEDPGEPSRGDKYGEEEHASEPNSSNHTTMDVNVGSEDEAEVKIVAPSPDSSGSEGNDITEKQGLNPKSNHEGPGTPLEDPQAQAEAQARFEDYLRILTMNDLGAPVPRTMILVPREILREWCAKFLPESLEHWPTRSSFSEVIRKLKRLGRVRQRKYRAFAVCPISMRPMPSNGGRGFPVWLAACEPTMVEMFVRNHPYLIAAVCAAGIGARETSSVGGLAPFLLPAILAPGMGASATTNALGAGATSALTSIEIQIEAMRRGPSVVDVEAVQGEPLQGAASRSDNKIQGAPQQLDWVPFWTHEEYTAIRNEIIKFCGPRSVSPKALGLRVVESKPSSVRLFVSEEEADVFMTDGVARVHDRVQFYDHATERWCGWRDGVPAPLD